MTKKYLPWFVLGGALFLLFRKDDGTLPSDAVTAITKIKNAIGMQKGGINNPGNIRSTEIKWKGKITKPGDSFESFDTLENGIRAMYKNLMSYRSRGINSIHEIIHTWAPESDNNNTPAYIKTVSLATKLSPISPLDIMDYPSLISAMSKVEGNHFVTADQVKAVV
jgi:hypothetical protein